MKKLKAALAALAAAICLAVPAFADIVVEPEPTAGENLLLVLGLAVVAVVAAVLIAAAAEMRKLARTLPLVLVFALCLMSYALADIATGATFGVFIGIPLLIIAVAVIVVSVAVKALRRRREKDDDK